MKILYITYENLFGTAILQAMVLKPVQLLARRHDIKFTITSSVKKFEKNEIYLANKSNFKKSKNIIIKEFNKNLTKKQSIFTFMADILPQTLFAIKEARKNDIIHCRGYGGAVIGLIASTLTSKPFIFDMRGLLPEETVDVGKISEKSIKFKILKFIERLLIRRAGLVITISEKFKNYIENNFTFQKVINTNNPTDFSMFQINKMENNKVNFIYSGSSQVWHMPNETIKIYSRIQKKFKNKVYLYFLSNDKNSIQEIFDSYSIPKNSYEIKTVPYKNIPDYYSKAQIAFCLIKESKSKSVCFPVKFSEYVAANHQIICNRNIGDIADITTKYNCGIVLDDVLSDKSFIKIKNLTDKILKNSVNHYNRQNLNFLDWDKKIIDQIKNAYISLKK